MTGLVRRSVTYAWNYIFNHEISPLRHIPDIAIRHYVLQALGVMWAFSFSIATGSYVFLGASLIGHTVLAAAAAITVATWTASTIRPQLFAHGAPRTSESQ